MSAAPALVGSIKLAAQKETAAQKELSLRVALVYFSGLVFYGASERLGGTWTTRASEVLKIRTGVRTGRRKKSLVQSAIHPIVRPAQ